MSDPKIRTVATLKELSLRALTSIVEVERLVSELHQQTDRLEELISAEREELPHERD